MLKLYMIIERGYLNSPAEVLFEISIGLATSTYYQSALPNLLNLSVHEPNEHLNIIAV